MAIVRLNPKYQPIGNYAAADHTHTPASIGAAAASHGNHVPAVQTASNSKFLRNDNTWQTVTPANIGAMSNATTSKTYTFTGGNCYARKLGRIVMLHVAWGGSNKAAGTTLTTLDAAYRPWGEYQVMRNGFDNQQGEIVVNTNGTVVYESNNGSASYGRASFCYIAGS